jgi:hypothetical protein
MLHSYRRSGMTLTEWLLFFAIIDGPIVGALYLILKRFKK